jgi:ankyrin repeat protein
LDAGADVNLEGGLYGSPLQAASSHGNLRYMRKFLELEAYVNTNVGWYGSPLQGAAKRGSLAAVKLLLEHGADVNLRGGKYWCTLQAAVCYHSYNKPDTSTSFLKTTFGCRSRCQR